MLSSNRLRHKNFLKKLLWRQCLWLLLQMHTQRPLRVAYLRIRQLPKEGRTLHQEERTPQPLATPTLPHPLVRILPPFIVITSVPPKPPAWAQIPEVVVVLVDGDGTSATPSLQREGAMERSRSPVVPTEDFIHEAIRSGRLTRKHTVLKREK